MTQYQVLTGGSANDTITGLTVGTNGQLLIGGTTSPAFATITGTGGITFTTGNNSLVINGTGGGLTWNVNTTTPITVAINNGYIANESSATLVYNLPATAAVGSMVTFTNISSNHNWQVVANTGQVITLGTVASTTAGSATSTNNGDSITLVCTVANTNWQVISSIGNITLA